MLKEPTEQEVKEFDKLSIKEQNQVLARREEALKQQEKELEAFKTIFKALNWMGHEEEVAENLVYALRHEHRTLQASFWKMVQAVSKEYAKFDTDLRNEQAVKFAKEIAKLDVYIPFI